jgi:CheY-like chemotaxis protein
MSSNTDANNRATNARRPPAPTPSILVVDADADTRALYHDSLAIAGCGVVEAPDGRDALVQALMHPPALVITEIRLPFIDGYALCEILRGDRATTDIPILVITSEARPEEANHARESGADVVLVKPTTPEQMLSEARQLLARAKVMRGRAASTIANAAAQREKSRSFSRFNTTTPPASPPALVCPSCDHPLTYQHSHIGGVSECHLEQWDYYECQSCGTFEHRQRTRKLRNAS